MGLIPLDGKRPIGNDWPNREFAPHEFDGRNIGVTLDGLADVDLDSCEARALAADVLPCSARFGRGGEITHYVYAHAIERAKFRDPVDGTLLLELRGGHGQQTMIPPSVHPTSGETLVWADQDVVAVDPTEGAHTLAIAALVARHWPPVASYRDDAAMALAGLLAGRGWTAERIDCVLSCAPRFAGDMERRAKGGRTVETIAAGRPCTGATRLRELMPAAVVTQIESWAGAPIVTVAEHDRILDLVSELSAGRGRAWFDAEPMAALVHWSRHDPTLYQRVLSEIKDSGCRALTEIKSAVRANARRAPRVHGLTLGANGEPRAVEGNVTPFLADAIVWDTFSDRVLDAGTRRPWVDGDYVDFACRLQREFGVMASKQLVAASVTSDAVPRVHVVREWLEGLRWDGVSRIAAVSEWLGVGANALVEPWLRSAVARARRPGCKADYMLVLQGDEGLGKSSGLRALFDPWFADTAIDLAHRSDAYAALRGVWCYEIADWASFSRADLARIKAYLTSTSDTYRRPYATEHETRPRTTIFAGTINDRAFLDSGDNRRFWICRVTRQVDVAALAENRAQIWAELAATQGPHWLADETPAREARVAFRVDDPLAIRVRQWLVTAPARFTIVDICDGIMLGANSASRADRVRIQDALVTGGCARDGDEWWVKDAPNAQSR